MTQPAERIMIKGKMHGTKTVREKARRTFDYCERQFRQWVEEHPVRALVLLTLALIARAMACALWY